MTTTWDQSKFLPDQTTKLSESDAVRALKEAFKNVYKSYPSNNTLAILYAQTALETGRFKTGFHCYNWGNIKSRPDDGFFWTMFRCSEVIKGINTFFDPPNDQCKFKAYRTAIEGAEDYISFLSKRIRYAKAWAQLLAGNPEQYSHELHVAGYYTADEGLYTKGVISLTNEFHKKYDNLSGEIIHNDPPQTIPQLFTDAELSIIKASIVESGNFILDDYFKSTTKSYDDDEISAAEPIKLGFWDGVKNIFTK